MSNYRRSHREGGTWFFTVVTHHRRPLLTEAISLQALREVICEVRQDHPFSIDAWVLLPDHIHAIWTLPQNDNDFSKRWGLIKAGFTKRLRKTFHQDTLITTSRKQRHEGSIWQRRFWEHEIRDETDFIHHMDYLHYNPVKHELVDRVVDWPHSTFHRLVRSGAYHENWGGNERALPGNYGE